VSRRPAHPKWRAIALVTVVLVLLVGLALLSTFGVL
jgi:hypothetical protein